MVLTMVFVVVGIRQLIGTAVLVSSGVSTEGVVVRVDTEQRVDNGKTVYENFPIVSFKDNANQMVEFRTGGRYLVGNKVNVLYDAKNPSHAEIASFSNLWAGPILFTGFGTVMFFIMFFIWRAVRKRSKIFKWLETNGTRIIADVIDIHTSTETKSTTSQNSRRTDFRREITYWYIKAQYMNPADNTIYIFKSDPLRYDPTQSLVSKKIEVLVNPQDFTQYRLLTDALPNVVIS